MSTKTKTPPSSSRSERRTRTLAELAEQEVKRAAKAVNVGARVNTGDLRRLFRRYEIVHAEQ